MPRQFFSPYGPRPRRSARLVILWMVAFLTILWLTWYISSRHRERAKPYVEELLRPGSRFGDLKKGAVPQEEGGK